MIFIISAFLFLNCACQLSNNKKAQTTVVIISTLCLCLLLFSLYKTYNIETKEDTIVSSEIPNEFNNFKVVFASDIHMDCSNTLSCLQVTDMVEKMNNLNPDVIIFG